MEFVIVDYYYSLVTVAGAIDARRPGGGDQVCLVQQ